jgi:hypothetical protein
LVQRCAPPKGSRCKITLCWGLEERMMDIFIYFLIMKKMHMHTYCAHECFTDLFSHAVL